MSDNLNIPYKHERCKTCWKVEAGSVLTCNANPEIDCDGVDLKESVEQTSNHLLPPCNNCWSEAELEREFEERGSWRASCLNKSCENATMWTTWKETAIGCWVASNPISHAGKMLLEKSFEIMPRPLGGDWYECKYCDGGTYTDPEGPDVEEINMIDIALFSHHSTTCLLITEAKLPLKVKDKENE